MQYFFLLIAVVFEVSGTMMLPVSQNFTRLMPNRRINWMFSASFYFLTLALNTMPIAVVYATWSGLGIFLVTVFGYFVFQQPLEWPAILGLAMIVGGVVLVNTYASHK